MCAAAPPGLGSLDGQARRRLADLTQALIAARPDAEAEHARFLSIRQRELCLPAGPVASWLGGATVLVTGGTGCVGSELMRQVGRLSPARLVSVSRGVTAGWPRVDGAEYRVADVQDRRAMDDLIGEVGPDVVFHLAAQRQPGLAETEVHRTVSTNLVGTRNVLLAAAEAEVPRFVYASTGKALRPYSTEIYAASKRAAEWVALSVAARGSMVCSAARFTHVADNSIIYRRLLEWARGGVVRLHGPHTGFYVQSARESAQLLLLAGLGTERGTLMVHAITDLGWPISLLDLALGVLVNARSTAPVYFSGYDRGYEADPFPGLYDPRTAGDRSPLLNAFEAGATVPSPCPMLDSFRLEIAPDARSDGLLRSLEEVCLRTRDADAVRCALGELSWSLFDDTLDAAPRAALVRAATAAQRHEDALSADHRRVLDAIRYAAAQAAPQEGPRPEGSRRLPALL